MTNGLLTDLAIFGLSIPPKFFFENFIDNAFQLLQTQLFIDNTHLKRSIFRSYLSYFHPQIQDIKSFGSMKQAACLVCRKPQKDVCGTCQHSNSGTPWLFKVTKISYCLQTGENKVMYYCSIMYY